MFICTNNLCPAPCCAPWADAILQLVSIPAYFMMFVKTWVQGSKAVMAGLNLLVARC